MDQWVVQFELNKLNHHNQSLEEEVVIITTLGERSGCLIDIEQEPGFYGCLGEWAAQFEPRMTVDHCLNHPVEPTSKSCSELIDITTEAIDAYQCLDLWAKQFDDNASNDTLIEILHSETNNTITSAIVFGGDHAGDHSPLKGLRTKAIVTAASDIFYDGHNAADDATLRESYSETTATNSSNTDILYDGNSKTTNTTAATTPEQDNNHSLGTPLRLKTPEDFARRLPRTSPGIKIFLASGSMTSASKSRAMGDHGDAMAGVVSRGRRSFNRCVRSRIRALPSGPRARKSKKQKKVG